MTMTKVAISLPKELLESIEKKRKATGETRSQFVRRAVEEYIKREQERDAIERYIRGYQEQPETEEDVLVSQATLQGVFAENPWKDNDRP